MHLNGDGIMKSYGKSKENCVRCSAQWGIDSCDTNKTNPSLYVTKYLFFLNLKQIQQVKEMF